MAINITQNVEGIAKQVLDINKEYINKSINVISRLQEGSAKEKITNINKELIGEVFSGIMKLNLEYYSKILDYGFSVTNQILSSQNNQETAASFTLSATGKLGSVINLEFVLDNTKEEKAFCQFESSTFINVDNQTENPEISISFEPQSFELDKGKSVKINIACTVSGKSLLGTYCTSVKVIGFEPAYFTIVLNIEKNTNTNARKKQNVDKGEK